MAIFSLGLAARDDELLKLAEQLDLQPVDQPAFRIRDAFFANFPLMATGNHRSLDLMFEGAFCKAPVIVFDFSFETHKAWRQTIYAFQAPGARLPRMSIQPLKAIQQQPLDILPPDRRIELPLSARFAERFEVFGRDESAVIEFCQMHALNYLNERAQWNVQTGAQWFLAYRLDVLPRASEYARALREAYGVFRAFGLE